MKSLPPVLLAGDRRDWPPDLFAALAGEGYSVDLVSDLDRAPAVLLGAPVAALLVGARPLGANEVLALRRCREVSPRTAIVVVAGAPTPPDLKRAFEDGATAFLSWPTSAEALRRALDSGEPRAREGGTKVRVDVEGSRR